MVKIPPIFALGSAGSQSWTNLAKVLSAAKEKIDVHEEPLLSFYSSLSNHSVISLQEIDTLVGRI